MNDKIKTFQREKNTLISKGVRAAKTIGVAARVEALRSYIGAGDVANTISRELAGLEDIIFDAMVAAHLSGRLRAILTAADYIKRREKPFGPYVTLTAFLRKRMDVSEMELITLKAKYGDTATDVTRIVQGHVEVRAKEAVAEIAEQGMHVRQGVVHLRQAFTDAGIETAHPFLLETLVRSQIEIAYGAGRWNANQDPEINEIIWGYEYFTVGDERVRPTHAALNGARLPKEHSRWGDIWPPNGFNCRCEVVEVFAEESHRIADIPSTKVIEGTEVVPGADEGWDINHGQVYADMISGAGIK